MTVKAQGCQRGLGKPNFQLESQNAFYMKMDSGSNIYNENLKNSQANITVTDYNDVLKVHSSISPPTL